jgi:hypothetical protein
MAWPCAHVREAEFLEELSDVALMEVDAEPLRDDPLEVHPAPAHDAVFRSIRAGLDDDGELGQLRGRQARLGTLRPIVDETLRPGGVEPMHPVAQRLPVHAAHPGRRPPVQPVPHRG